MKLKYLTQVALTIILLSSAVFARPLPPLVREVHPIHTPTKGLQGRHLAVWQSHGYYYEQSLDRWEWQRARIFQTVEDLYTQSYVLPFLVPMLEQSGAVVLLPRERDTSYQEYIIDNDPSDFTRGRYSEQGSGWSTIPVGFRYTKRYLRDRENPFEQGSAREIRGDRRGGKSAFWAFEPKERGEHAVYVSYRTLPESPTDALYTVHHAGGATSFYVNQTMGGGTWIYLGTFTFDPSHQGQGVSLSNKTRHRGARITADAVKIGGGMGNVERAYTDTLSLPDEWARPLGEFSPSGYPRFCEGARYWLQWAGAPDSVYSPTKGHNDYTDDYRCRGYWVNHLLGGSKAWPQHEGLQIPIDLSFAFHSDAGTYLGDSIVGTLGIVNTTWERGRFPDGSPRTRARTYVDQVMESIVRDIRALHAPEWVSRGVWDKAYSEATHPAVPSMLLELLSHQNFPDMRYGLDPEFRFTVSRAIYKGILRYLSDEAGVPYVVQPLPVRDMVIELMGEGSMARLSWAPTEDPLEVTATPRGYVVYTSVDGGAFDAGRRVQSPRMQVSLMKGRVYRFKVVAINEGGRSFPSEILSVGIPSGESKGRVLVVNGFTRVSAPDWFDLPESHLAGFWSMQDGGVPYLRDISYVGAQRVFDRRLPWIDDDYSGFGDSRATHETKVVAGNSFDYPYSHGRAILDAGYAFSSLSRSYAEQHPEALLAYDAVDLILGKQKQTDKGPRDGRRKKYKALSRPLRQALSGMAEAGKGIFVSGAYVGFDLWCDMDSVEQAEGQAFAKEVLHLFLRTGAAAVEGELRVVQNGLGLSPLSLSYLSELSDKGYAVESPDAIEPTPGASTVMRYSENNLSAAVAYRGKYRSFVMGVPFEAIEDIGHRQDLMREILHFLTSDTTDKTQ